MSKGKPSGFTATCVCGAVVGAMDYKRTDRRDAGTILGEWLNDGCTVTPQFDSQWSATIESCKCGTPLCVNAA